MPASPNEVRLSYAPIVQRVAPAVVNVYAARDGRQPQSAAGRPDLPALLRRAGRPGGRRADAALARLRRHRRCRRASSSPTTTSSRAPTEVKVSLADKREFEADIVLKDHALRPRGAAHQGARASASRPSSSPTPTRCWSAMSCWRSAIRSRVGQTVTHGIVSAVARTQVGITDYQFFIQTDAAINPGNSGGALVDMTGKLVGINTAIFSRSGGSQGIGFAIPANMVRVVVASAKGGGTAVKRPWLGARLQAVTPEIAESLGLKRPAGALIASVAPASPAARGRPQDRRPDRLHRRPAGRRSQCLRLPLRHQGARRHGSARRRARRPGDDGRRGARDRARYAARRAGHRRRSPFHGREGRRTFRRRWPMSCGSTRPPKASCSRRRQRLAGAELRFPARATSCSRSTIRRSPRPAISNAPPPSRAGSGASPSGAAASRCRSCWADEPARQPAAADRACSRRRASIAMRRGRSPTSCGRRSSPRSSARIICSGPTAR